MARDLPLSGQGMGQGAESSIRHIYIIWIRQNVTFWFCEEYEVFSEKFTRRDVGIRSFVLS